jgi:homoserine kinase type II
MAVYTPLSDDDLAALLADYDIGAPSSFEGIAAGVENSNFKLITNCGRYILTIFERRVVAADLPFFIGVMARLAERGFPAPKPIATRDGATLASAKGKPAAIVSFLDGDWPRQPSLPQCLAIGAALARMHRALEGFELTRANALGPQGWEALIRPRLAAAEYLRPGLAASVERDLDEVRARWPDDLPRGAIHADLFPDNALFVGERLSGVIDFYFACTDFLSYDLAVCLNAWCFEDERVYDAEKGRALIAGYESERPLSGVERAALPTLARGAALRFFATRLADWAETPAGALVKPKKPLEYADKLVFHRRTLGARDYGG